MDNQIPAPPTGYRTTPLLNCGRLPQSGRRSNSFFRRTRRPKHQYPPFGRDEEMNDTVYTWEEVAKHKSKQDGVWVVVHNEVYDVTKFLDDHPGGEEVILEQAGGDATEAFDDIGHSPDAKNLQKNFQIGKISEPKGFVPRSTDDTTTKPEEPQGFSYDVILKVAILIVLVLIAYSIISPYLFSK